MVLPLLILPTDKSSASRRRAFERLCYHSGGRTEPWRHARIREFLLLPRR